MPVVNYNGASYRIRWTDDMNAIFQKTIKDYSKKSGHIRWADARKEGVLGILETYSDETLSKRASWLRRNDSEHKRKCREHYHLNKNRYHRNRKADYLRRCKIFSSLAPKYKNDWKTKSVWTPDQWDLLLDLTAGHRKGPQTTDWHGVVSDPRSAGLPYRDPHRLSRYMGSRIRNSRPHVKEERRKRALEYKKRNYLQYLKNQDRRRKAIHESTSKFLYDKFYVNYWTLPRLEGLVSLLDGNLDKKDESFRAAVLIFAFFVVGSTDVEELKKLTGYPQEFISKVFGNLERNEVIKDGVYHTETGVKDIQKFTIEFWLHVLAALGEIERADLPKKSFKSAENNDTIVRGQKMMNSREVRKTYSREEIIEAASECRNYATLSRSLNIQYSAIRTMVYRLGIQDELDEIFKKNKSKGRTVRNYTKSQILDLASRCRSMDHIGKHLGICRERVRQILNILKIVDEVKKTLRKNRLDDA